MYFNLMMKKRMKNDEDIELEEEEKQKKQKSNKKSSDLVSFAAISSIQLPVMQSCQVHQKSVWNQLLLGPIVQSCNLGVWFSMAYRFS